MNIENYEGFQKSSSSEKQDFSNVISQENLDDLNDVTDSDFSFEEDDEEEEEESLEEPKLKFDRVRNDLSKILDKDSISCSAVHSKYICLGSQRGEIYILDHLGNNVSIHPRKSIEAHKVQVNQISIDQSGDHIASCSDDGIVNIFSLCDNENILSLNLNRKIRCIAIDPQYSRGGLNRRFIIGEENVTLYERTLFSRLKATILTDGGPVSNIKWGDRFVAWSWRGEVKVYDMQERATINRVQFSWKEDMERRRRVMSDFQCSIHWNTPFSFFIGWADEVVICQIKMKNNKDSRGRFDNNEISDYFVQLQSHFVTDFWTCGISSFGSILLLLCRDKEETNAGQRPKLNLIQPFKNSHNIISCNVLQTRGYSNYNLSDYHLDTIAEDLLFYVVSPKDIVFAKSRDQDDRIQWLIDHQKYEEALDYANQNAKSITRYSVLQVGIDYLDHLLENNKFNEAGKLCLNILTQENVEKWEEQVAKFANLGKLRSIAPYLPRTEKMKLSPYIYEIVLFDYLKNDPEEFLKLVRDWAPPPNLYNVEAIVNAVLDQLLVCEPHNKFLHQALADLYSYQRKFGKAFAMYLKLQDCQVFHLIQRYGLFEELKDKIADLMALNMNEALNLFMKFKDKINPSLVIDKLKECRFHQYKYLDSLYKAEGKEMREEFHDLMVCLYAAFDHESLFQFLKSSDGYNLEEALRICKERKHVPEMIYLLTRMGNTKEALRIIIYELDDINEAINFCKEHDYQDLWDDLIDFSLDKPSYINLLLCNIGTHVDPQILIRKIENGMEIPGLRDSLVTIIQDYSLQVALQEGCKNILVGDCLVLFKKLVKTQLRGVSLEDDQDCGSCHKKILVRDFSIPEDVKVFYCKHVFHDACLSGFDDQNCIICNLPRKGACFLEKL